MRIETADVTVVAYAQLVCESQSITARMELIPKLEEAINELRDAVNEE